MHLLVIYMSLDLIEARKMDRVKSTNHCSGRFKVYMNKMSFGGRKPATIFPPSAKFCPHRHVHIGFGASNTPSRFCGLEVACWPLVPKFAGSHPAEAVGFLGRKKSSAPLLSEGKYSCRSHVVALRHVKDP